MKHYLLILLAFGAIAPVSAMGKKQPKIAPEGFFHKYMDTFNLIVFIFRTNRNEKANSTSFIEKMFSLIAIEKFPLKLAQRETTIGEFFKVEDLKNGLSDFLSRLLQGKIEKRHLGEFLENILSSLNEDAIKKEFGDDEWVSISKGFDLLIDQYYEGEVEGAIDLKNVPELFGCILKDYFIIEKLTEALNDALNGHVVLTKSTLLDCIDIEQIAKREAYDKISRAEGEGIRELIEVLFCVMDNDGDATYKVLNILGAYRTTKKVADDSNNDAEDKHPAAQCRPVASSSSTTAAQKPAVSSSTTTAGRSRPIANARAKSAQEASDEALARKLQQELNQ